MEELKTMINQLQLSQSTSFDEILTRLKIIEAAVGLSPLASENLNLSAVKYQTRKGESQLKKYLLNLLQDYSNSKRRSLEIVCGSYTWKSDEYEDNLLLPVEQLIASLTETTSLQPYSWNDEEMKKYSQDSRRIFTMLAKQKEKVVQKHLFHYFRSCTKLGLLDTSLSSRNTPCIKQPDESSECFTFSGRPDATGLLFPFFLEIKDTPGKRDKLSQNENLIIMQILDRLDCTMTLNETLTFCAGICTAGRKAWLLTLTRRHEDTTTSRKMIQDRIEISQIKCEDIFPLIIQLNEDLERRGGFYHRHMSTIATILVKMGIHPGYSRIKIVKYMNSAIYEVIPYSFSNSKTLQVPVDPASQSFLIKINRNAENARKELHVLSDLQSKLGPDECSSSPLGYVIALFDKTDLRFFDENYFLEVFSSSLVKSRWKQYGSPDRMFFLHSILESPPLKEQQSEKKEEEPEDDDSVDYTDKEIDLSALELAIDEEEGNGKASLTEEHDPFLMNPGNRFMPHLTYSSFQEYTYQNHVRCWFTFRTTGQESLHEAIVMKKGVDPFLELGDVLSVHEELCVSLKWIWERGYSHSDIRPSNFIKIESSYFLIDFDHAIALEDSGNALISSLNEGDRKNCITMALRVKAVKLPITWTMKHEINMLFNALQILAMNNSNRSHLSVLQTSTKYSEKNSLED
eukprot:gene6546-7048_t